MTSLLGGEPMDTTQTKQDFKDIGTAFTGAGASAETKKNEMDDATDKMFAVLEARQRLLEKIAGSPEFPEAEAQKAHESHIPRHSGESSDALIKVGNFLGASKDTLTGLAQRQVDLLQRIEHNTRGRSHSTHFEESIFPQR